MGGGCSFCHVKSIVEKPLLTPPTDGAQDGPLPPARLMRGSHSGARDGSLPSARLVRGGGDVPDILKHIMYLTLQTVEREMVPSHLPAWCAEAVMYQIFPLGFLSAPYENDHESQVVPRLADLRKYYRHLEELGVNCVYFGPLFESSTHGYDTVDHYKVDRRLGDLDLLKQIVKELKGHGFRVLFDGVFNHTGTPRWDWTVDAVSSYSGVAIGLTHS
eukprot:1179619-Prorocentrum_minimum.AAC.1